MYVPGKIEDSQNFLIDVGTGYYVEKVGDIIIFIIQLNFLSDSKLKNDI